MLPYLAEQGVSMTRQINNNTFQAYPVWRKAKKSTRRLELIFIGHFLQEYCKRNGLLDPDITVAEIKPKITIKDSEIDANPPLIELGNWSNALTASNNNRERASQLRNKLGFDYAKLFYR